MRTATARQAFRLVNAIMMALVLSILLQAQLPAQDQPAFKVGDRIEADVNMSSYPENSSWRKATITKIEMWNGQVSGYQIRTDDGREIMVAARHMRHAAPTQKDEEARQDKAEQAPPAKAPPQEKNGQKTAQFKVGDRVEVDSIMANDAKDSHWRKATVKAVDLANRRYVVTLDDFNEMSVLIRPGKTWIRSLNDGSRKPALPPCAFNKNYPKVSHNAPASPTLFKSVIFEWQKSIQKFYDFGLTFLSFKMGKPFKNNVNQQGVRILDYLPIGVTVYPIKARELICRKDLNVTLRTVRDIEYACYKNQYSEWVCKSGAPKTIEHISIPHK